MINARLEGRAAAGPAFAISRERRNVLIKSMLRSEGASRSVDGIAEIEPV